MKTMKTLLVAATISLTLVTVANAETTEWVPNSNNCTVTGSATFSPGTLGNAYITFEGGVATETEVLNACETVERPKYLVKMDRQLVRLEKRLAKAEQRLENLINKGKTKNIERQKWYVKWLKTKIKSQTNWVSWLEDFFGIKECNPETEVIIEPLGSTLVLNGTGHTMIVDYEFSTDLGISEFPGLSFIEADYVRITTTTEVTSETGEITFSNVSLSCN